MKSFKGAYTENWQCVLEPLSVFLRPLRITVYVKRITADRTTVKISHFFHYYLATRIHTNTLLFKQGRSVNSRIQLR